MSKPGIWTRWTHELPPADATVEGAWTKDPYKEEKPSSGKRCKHGCCFNADFGAQLIPPIWWRLPDTTAGSRE